MSSVKPPETSGRRMAAGLWRAPVSVDLGALSSTTPGVSTLRLDAIQQLRDDGYNHFGDLVCNVHAGHGYVLVPIETGGERAGVAAFRADATLVYLDHINLFPDPLSHQSHWSWAGVDPQGRLYSSNFDGVDRLIRYEVDWDHLDATGELLISNETAGFQRVAQSSSGVGPFNFEFSGPPSGDEPEGLTIWDLEATASRA